jgi:hypothetical protein
MQTVENARSYEIVEMSVDISRVFHRKLRTPFFFHSLRILQQKCGLHTSWVLTEGIFTIVSITSTAETVDEFKSWSIGTTLSGTSGKATWTASGPEKADVPARESRGSKLRKQRLHQES